MIDSVALAQRIDAAFNDAIPADGYEARLSASGEVYWLEHRDGTSARHNTEPGTSFWKRAGVSFMSVLPIEWLL